LDVLANRNPEVKPKDDCKEKYPNYLNFQVDPNPPLKTAPEKQPKLNWRKLLSVYDGKKRSQIKCKVCSSLSQAYPLLVIASKQSISVLIAVCLFIFGKSEKRFLSINVAVNIPTALLWGYLLYLLIVLSECELISAN